jgi:hypothetical protein
MTYVPVVTPPPTPPSPRTRELAGLLTKVLEEYTKAHPATTRSEIRAALSMAARATGPAASASAALAVGLTLALVMGGVIFFYVQGGSPTEFRAALPMVIMSIIVFLGVLLLIIKRRSG